MVMKAACRLSGEDKAGDLEEGSRHPAALLPGSPAAWKAEGMGCSAGSYAKYFLYINKISLR